MTDESLNIMGLALFTILTCIFLTFIYADKRVEFYYSNSIQAHSSEVASVSCVYAHLPWETDNAVFCSADPEKTLNFLQKANEDLSRVKGAWKGSW